MESKTHKTKAPPYRGLDASPKDRPGVPREAAPKPLEGAHWTEPERQPIEGPAPLPGQVDRPTPVFSTALPPRGLSGWVRRAAHRIPDHRVTHWILLIVADRIDVVESLAPPRRRAG